ncbi:MAG: helix-turn-helix transcriptional regulator [Desulfurococcus sp.]|nr:helix-turn-helix transcriptional regulator [Desulfurococcus sp.]
MPEPKAYSRLTRKLTVENLWLYVVKILLDKGEPMRAYDIKIELRERFGINPPAITVYTAIYRMVRDGVLTRRQRGDEAVYTVSERGLEAFKKALVFMEEVLSKLKI